MSTMSQPSQASSEVRSGLAFQTTFMRGLQYIWKSFVLKKKRGILHERVQSVQLKLPQLAYSVWAAQFQMIFFKICGIAPFSVRVEATKKNDKLPSLIFNYSMFGVIYNLALIFCLTVSFVMIWCQMERAILTPTGSTLSHLIAELELSERSFLVCVVLLNFLWSQKSAVRIADKISNVDRSLMKFDSFVTKTSPSFYVFYFLLHSLYWLHAFTSIRLEVIFDLRICINLFLSTLIVYEVLIQYSITVTLVKKRFQTMNQILSDLAVIEAVRIPPLMSRYGFRNSPMITQVKDLKRVHRSLCEICDEIDKFYSLPVLASIGYIFIELVHLASIIIFTFTQFHNEDNIWLNNTHKLALWLLLISPVVSLTFNVSKLLEEVKRTGKEAHVLLNRTLTQEVMSELKEFSLQLLHHKVQFSCYGFFDLNLALLHSILHTTATYLVILVQYSPNNIMK